MARKFFYVCAGILMLALTYHLGARSAGAQAGASIAGYSNNGPDHYVVTTSGDIYFRQATSPSNSFRPTDALFYVGNIWAAGATTSQSTTWGQVKATYRK